VYFLCLAADYDGTIAQHGAVTAETCDALRQLKASGRRLVLVTGRELADLKHAFPEITLFDRVVAENGAVIYDPNTEQERAVAPPPPPAFVQRLLARNVEPISVGHSIVATWEPHQTAVLGAIQELGLELQIVFNKGAVMVLPPGVNKASGLRAALSELDISIHNVVAVGDAENDHAFLRACGCAAAVANALPTIIEEADIRLSGDHGAGVIELVKRIMKDDARIVPPTRRGLLAGIDRTGSEVYLEPNENVLIVGASGSGKSRFAKLLTERMVEKQFEFCVIDPEGDYDGLKNAVSIADGSTAPRAEEALRLLRETEVNVVINILALALSKRQRLLAKILPSIRDLRAQTGRPHWLVIDEAHQVLGAGTNGPPPELLNDFPASILITTDPRSLARNVLKKVDAVLAFDPAASKIVADFTNAIDMPVELDKLTLEDHEVLFWSRSPEQLPRVIKIETPRQDHRRHQRKYAIGDVGEWHSFYFRGLGNAINLRAKNVLQFLEIAQQVDDATWEHHLRARDYSEWFRNVIKDEELAGEVGDIAGDLTLTPCQSRERVKKAVSRRYTVSA
jgi:hydroxymethylpyrimidine pyrophosphatase-like HAD family hydrolase/energy-coupling factor transporter ATP-binding protein EcfA2